MAGSSVHDRGDFSLPDWCDERWSRPTPSDPCCGARFLLFFVDGIHAEAFPLATVWSVYGESSARRTSSVCPLPRMENGVCHPFPREGMRASMNR
jgi:hypothetical protein